MKSEDGRGYPFSQLDIHIAIQLSREVIVCGEYSAKRSDTTSSRFFWILNVFCDIVLERMLFSFIIAEQRDLILGVLWLCIGC